MKLSYLILLLFTISTFKLYSTPPRSQYCVSYCTKEDTVFDTNHNPILNNGVTTFHCTNYFYEFHNGECPQENRQGLNSLISPTQCSRLKNYNGQAFQGDGVNDYKDANGISWFYVQIGRTGETDNPRVFISYSKKTSEYCLEIPLLKYKIVLFLNDENRGKKGYYERLELNGTTFTSELIKESLPKEASNPAEIRRVYDFKYLLEENRNSLITTNPNPFDREIIVTLTKETLDSNTNLKMVLKDIKGNKISEQLVEGPNTTISTAFVEKGKYILFLYKKEDILDYKQMYK